MFSSLFKGVGKLFLFLAAMAFLALVSVFVIGSFILTWPILRMSPRDRRIKSSMDFASSGMTMLTAFTDGSIRKAVADAMEEPAETETSDFLDDVTIHNDGTITWKDTTYTPIYVDVIPED